MDIITKARNYAYMKHQDQKDDSGSPYFFHLVQVVNILSQITDDENIIAAGYLHDILEDTYTPASEIYEIFGTKITDFVIELTKDTTGKFPYLKSREAILIKFADRLSNLSRMENWSKDKKNKYIASSKFWKS